MESYSQLQEKIDRYFPEHLTFTLADGRLDAGELRRISHSRPVPGTGWDVEILPDKTLYSQAHRSILVQALLLFAGFIVVSVIMRMILLDEQD
jgi:hypothetical protein